MDSASRLYERLGNIPQDPDDPESLEDLLVCAFGAFERFYLCWKTKGGEYRQGKWSKSQNPLSSNALQTVTSFPQPYTSGCSQPMVRIVT
jgi:hypothetical protein